MTGTWNVNVAVRVCPENEAEKSIVDILEEKDQIVVNKHGESNNFTFNHVFPGKATQKDVYNKCVQPLIGNILKGYNVSIMAYGQSGSGKTYTMGTHYNPDEQMGVIPRAIIEVFELARDHFSYDCKITVSFLEVFNDTVYDLFTRKPKDQSVVDSMENSWEGLTEIPANSAREVLNLLQKAVLKRACEPTPLSIISSRSHAMFCLNIAMTHKTDKKESKNAKLLLIDLAAAENKDRTSKNGVNVVKNGVLALNRVINCLSSEDTMDSVPYEDSILTRLLKDALGGNSKTLVITCISSSEKNVEETISNLKMAVKMKKIKNQPMIQKNITTNDIIDHTAVSSRSQKRTDSFYGLVLNGLSKLKNKMLEIVDDDKDLHNSSSISGNQIENGLGTTVSEMDHQTKEFKQVQKLLTALEEQLENINEKFKFNNHRLNELEKENDVLKENIKTLEITDKKNKMDEKTKVAKKRNKIIKKKMSRGSSRLSVFKIEDLLDKSEVESTDSPFGSKVTVRRNKLKKDESQLKRKTIDKENVDSSEENLVKATKKSSLEERVLSEKRINANKEEDTINKGQEKQLPALGCNCKLDCSRKQCGCKRIGKGCDSSCKCKQSVCRNRIQTDNSSEVKETEESFEDGSNIKRKKTTKENIARKKKVR